MIYFMLCLIGSILFIFLDELMMGLSQSRIGPFNLGLYGILTLLINGYNLCISQFLIPKFNIDFWFQFFPMLFFIFSFCSVIIHYPFFLIDLYISMIFMLLLTFMSTVFIIFSSFSGCSKYSMLGSISMISQFLSFELMFTTMLLIFIWSWNFNDISIVSMWFTGFLKSYNISHVFLFYWFILLHFNHVFLLFFFISILGESNSVPFDLLEAESELVAGFITEYSSIYFTLILLTEYGNIIMMSFWMIIIFSLIPWSLMLFLFIVCFLRSTLNRLKFDELMTNAWIIILVLLFMLLILFIILI